ncbi:MAG: DUF1549 domain-containing protein [Planctomycetaceae bacterium]|jgi:hypothetical protein|nr:DUF1549 and DUF1553 domain-containing protein [Planctomycetaceae bacterium]MDG2389275.1 DUF1549 domain-containing protein [Planctomycetaceae bacterium]
MMKPATQLISQIRTRMLVLCGGLAILSAMSGVSAQAAEEAEFSTGSNEVLIKEVNQLIRRSWDDNLIKPSAVADDAEWLRRVYLDVVGHIPPMETVKEFVASKDAAKRSKVVDQLLDDPDYVRNWTTIWTNNSIGRGFRNRGDRDEVSRLGMDKFYREVFARNRPWNEVVKDIVTAEGNFEENGAVNFILAQMEMPDEGVQLTADFTKLFLGIQVQCTQCHDHPFNDWKQDQFWSYNSIFRQTAKDIQRKYDEDSGRMVVDFVEVTWRNVDQEEVFFERRNGEVRPAYPVFNSHKIDPAKHVDRRKEFGELLQTDTDKMVAAAMVNRMWGHFFGYGFTKPVDDMGPHNPPSHPEVMELLTNSFVESGYDVKQLVRWIANTEAYNLTSQFSKENEIDNPAAGEIPLFSHMYVKAMEVEQLYDSLIIATNAHKSGSRNFEASEQQRQRWLGEFITLFGDDENDSSTSFNGSIPQALMMMNGRLVTEATSLERGSFLTEIAASSGSDVNKVKDIYLATLSRYPNGRELSSISKLFRSSPNKALAYQDVLWALLNSNEFIVNH